MRSSVSMGIFAKWAMFEKAEVVLERRLRENSFYPFQEICEESSTRPVYVYSTRFRRFYLALLSSVATLLFTIIWPSAGGDGEYLVFVISLLAISVYLAVEYYGTRTVVLDPANEHYSVYRGTMLMVTHHCHNIYVRLVCTRTGSRHPTYQLVLDGCGFELPLRLSGEGTNRKKLRHLAHELAANLHINYFDIHNSSKHHIIRHNRPYTVPIEPREE